MKISSSLQLLTRADDAGMNESSNQGIRDAVEKGIARNISLMAPGPALQHAVHELRHLDACFGLHACLTAEWVFPRWGALTTHPESHWLKDSAGLFPSTGKELRQLNPPSHVVEAELAAQLACLRKLEFPIRYLDEHMHFTSALPELRPVLERFAANEGLVYVTNIPGVPAVEEEKILPAADYAGKFLKRLQAAPPGAYLVVSHPARDTAEMRRVHLEGQAQGGVAADRKLQSLVFTGPKILDFCAANEVRLLRYDELENRP